MRYDMESVGSYEAKTHLSQLLERVMKGEQITITKHGVPVAVLKPPDTREYIDTRSVIVKLREFREEHTLDGLSIREMIDEGRK